MIVQGVGPKTARILVIGEAPWKTEVKLGEPFVGASGNLLNRWLNATGLDRSAIRIDNLIQIKPPKRNVESFGPDEIISWIPRLHDRIADLDRLHVIVPLGNYATFALTGKGKVLAKVRRETWERGVTASEAEKKAGITSLRGSTYLYKDRWGREIKVIPTIHPAAVLQNPKWEKRCLRDWRVIKEESESRGYEPIYRNHVINPSEQVVKEFTDYALRSDEVSNLSVDIETWGSTLSCVGFATSPRFSITIPTTTVEQRQTFLPYIKQLCESNKEKILQNGLFDAYWLADYGLNLRNWTWDTLAMHHSFDPAESHGLDFLASYYTRQNYWKDEAKDAEEIRKYAKDLDSLWVYNGLDCCVTYEVWEALRKEKSFKYDFYKRHYQELFEPLLAMMRHGVNVDVNMQKWWAKNLLDKREGLLYALEKAAGESLMATKDFSGAKLRKFLYETLKLPVIKRTDRTFDAKTDEVVIKRLTQRFPKKIGEHGLNILKCRSLKKKADVMKKGADKDGRIRCTYKFTTEQGRLASSKNPRGRGYNLQNIEAESGGVRRTFYPDEGGVFVRVDASQIESRYGKMYCGTPRMIELANTKPWEYDEHTDNARMFYGVDKPTKEQRQRGKVFTHAFQRGVQAQTVADMLLKNDVVMGKKEVQKFLDRAHRAYPEFEEIYFPWVRGNLIRDKKLTNSWGRVIDYEFHRFDNDLWKKGYSFYLQSEGADHTNQLGIKAGYNQIKANHWNTRLNMQVHDEVVASCPFGEAYDWAKFLVESLETPRVVLGNTLVVPACVTVGSSWDGGHEFKRFPSREEFDGVVWEILNS